MKSFLPVFYENILLLFVLAISYHAKLNRLPTQKVDEEAKVGQWTAKQGGCQILGYVEVVTERVIEVQQFRNF